MKKSFFIKSFNPNMFLVLMAVLSSFIEWTLLQLANSFNQPVFSSLEISKLNLYLRLGRYFIFLALTGINSILFLSIFTEIKNRLRFDNLENYVMSIYHTFKLRSFLAQREKSKKLTTAENQHLTTYNPIIGSFNRCARKSVVDIRNEEVTVFIRVPRSQQGQKVLSDMMSQLKEEVSSQHPNYYFSSPNRFRNNLWLVGKKR